MAYFLTIANLAKEKDYQAWIFGKRAKHTNANDVPDKESRRTIDHLSVTIWTSAVVITIIIFGRKGKQATIG